MKYNTVVGEALDTKRKVEQEQEQEGLKERLEREHGELIEELRSLIPGAEVLFGFLLAIRFTGQFDRLDSTQRNVYYATLLTTALALVFLLAPAAYHRIRFREGDKEYMLRKANVEAIAGTVAIALAFTGVLFVVTDLLFGSLAAILVSAGFLAIPGVLWWGIPIYRTLRERDGAAHRG